MAQTPMEPNEAGAMARRAFESLSERDKAALQMREKGLNYDQIAHAMSVPRESVGTTLARARRRLAERYETLMRGREALGGVQF